MASFIVILIVIVAVLLGIVVLVQNPKGGGIDTTYGSGAQQMFGAARSTETIEKITWILAGALIFLCIASFFLISKNPANDVQLLSK